MLKTGKNLAALSGGNYGDPNYLEFTHLLRTLDLLIQAHVISATTLAPPASPANGDAYIIPAAATGLWLNKTNQIARWTDDLPTPTWEYHTPQINWHMGVDDVPAVLRFDGTVWVDDLGAIRDRLDALEGV